MTGIQKGIKIGAICFGVMLIVAIFGALLSLLTLFQKEDRIIPGESYSKDYSNISSIEIDVVSSNIVIREGSKMNVEIEGASETIKVHDDHDGNLEIEEEFAFFKKNTSKRIIITIPNGTMIRELSIDSGAGKIEIESIQVQELSIDQGAGLLELTDVSSKQTEIDGGAGEIKIKNSVLNDLDLDTGVGKVDIQADITGISEIDCGVGAVDLTLTGMEETYKIKAYKGIGTITINDQSYSSDYVYGNGNNIISIDGGIGEVKVSIPDSIDPGFSR